MAAGMHRDTNVILYIRACSETRKSLMRPRTNMAAYAEILTIPLSGGRIQGSGKGPSRGWPLQLLLPFSASFCPLLWSPGPEGVTQNAGVLAKWGSMRAVSPSIYPLILWSCLHFSLCLFYIFITSWGLRVEGGGGRSLVLSGPSQGGLFAEERCGHSAPLPLLQLLPGLRRGPHRCSPSLPRPPVEEERRIRGFFQDGLQGGTLTARFQCGGDFCAALL